MRFPLEVFDAVRAVWPADKPISVRISATDWVPGGFDARRRRRVRADAQEHGCDIIDVSTGQTTPDARPAYGRSYQTPFADAISNEVGIPTIAVGAISSYDDVNSILLAGRADLCALARPHLYDPAWTLHARSRAGVRGRRRLVAGPVPNRLAAAPGRSARPRRRAEPVRGAGAGAS